MNKSKILVLLAITTVILAYFGLDIDRFVTLEYIQGRLTELQVYARDNAVTASLVYLLAYIFFTALSVPGALLFTLMGGVRSGLGNRTGFLRQLHRCHTGFSGFPLAAA